MSILSVDFGGTRIKTGVVEGGEVLVHDAIGYGQGESLEQSMPRVRDLAGELMGRVDGVSALQAVVCALPCIVSPDRARVTRTFGKYDDAVGFDLNAWTEREMGVPCLLENDARAAAIGEWKFGAGKGVENLAMVTLGTGIGTAVIAEGRPLFGANGVAGNLSGHNTAHVGGRECVCGLRGCFEAHVATWALPGIARESDGFAGSVLSGVEKIDYRTVFAEAAGGDVLSIELRDRAIEYWATLVMNLMYQFDPEVIVMGGGIMAGKEVILPALQSKVAERVPELHRGTRLVAAELGDAAALAGGWVICDSVIR